LYVAVLEPFAVKSFRRVLDQIRDEALRENVERFSRQEAQHYQRHYRFQQGGSPTATPASSSAWTGCAPIWRASRRR
jgi:predicted metal-dependent hydrolase